MKAIDRISRARAGLILKAPFYATLAMGMEVAERDDASGVKTMATDGKHLFFNAAWVDSITDAELRGVVAHEVAHVANKHHTRRNGRDPKKWNVACDYAINPNVMADGFELPKGGLIDPQFAGMSAEQIFAKLPDMPGDDGQGGQNGQGGQPAPAGEVLDACDPNDKAAMAEAEADTDARVMQAAQIAAKAGKASATGALAADEIRKPRVDWRDVLTRYVDKARDDTSWSRPNRRHVASGLYLPGRTHDAMARLAVILDVSGSTVAPGTLAAFLGALQDACDVALPDVIDVIQCDTRVTRRDQFGPGEPINLTLTGGGGTDMQPALDLCEEASAVVVLTDCEFRRDPNPIAAPVLWARWGGAGRVPAWGELVDVPDA